MKDENLRRFQAPFLLPTSVRVNGEPEPNAAALRALAKRCLFWPANWPEELDDRTSVRGLLEVAFAGSFPLGGTAVLFLRARAGKTPPVCALNGVLRPLGHSAGKRGWQPFILPLVLPLRPDMTITTNIDAPLSRLLLGRN